eukprot:IDg9364t1
MENGLMKSEINREDLKADPRPLLKHSSSISTEDLLRYRRIFFIGCQRHDSR